MSNIIVTPGSEVIRTVENSIEYFTLVTTGESGMSISGEARFNGVDERSIRRMLKKVENSVRLETLPESLKTLVGKDLTLRTGITYKNANILNDNTCAALTEYYAFDAHNPTPEAKNALRGFHRIGLRHFIHQKTGWKPFADTDAVIQRLLSENAKLRARLKYNDGLPLLFGSLMLPLVEVAKIHGYCPGKERGALGMAVTKAVREVGYQPIRSRDPHTGGLVNFYPAYDTTVVGAYASFYAKR